jgi:alkaline phosphatase
MKKIAALFLALLLSGQLSSVIAAVPPKKKPKNIILMIGDGTGLVHLYAAYTAQGGKLNIYEFAAAVGLSITASANDYITDSAAGATALSTGKKTNNGMIGTAPDSSALETISERAHKNGMSTGVVVTCELPHATPASFYAHQVSRKMYTEIARDLSNSQADIMIGSGKPYFDTQTLANNGYTVSTGLAAMQQNKGKRQVCFTDADSFPAKAPLRGDALLQGSMHAITQLSQNKKGFFLMIEGSQIDWGAHDNDSANVIDEAIDFDKTAGNVLEWAAKDKNTLVIITADHECGGLTLHGLDSSTHRPVMHFSTGHHTAEPVPVYAYGPGAEQFSGVYQNTDIYYKMIALLSLEKKKK